MEKIHGRRDKIAYELSEGKSAISAKCVYKIKHKFNGSIDLLNNRIPERFYYRGVRASNLTRHMTD